MEFILWRSWYQSAAFFFTDIPKRYCGFVVLNHHTSFLMQTLTLIFIACVFGFNSQCMCLSNFSRVLLVSSVFIELQKLAGFFDFPCVAFSVFTNIRNVKQYLLTDSRESS
ncbi:hypothetical protein RvY_08368 [Ramazzottius varieornatus]|uniref:Uncharacterized protein n=1 Tax=Ramazzottius varieornatus TaxID=947166 RepID=A0A1D1V5L8_RAMVA|nr:hypothetical protein RvY_08368 [Ramazzottius varieornatus]